jgi:hypothetical protein
LLNVIVGKGQAYSKDGIREKYLQGKSSTWIYGRQKKGNDCHYQTK